MCNGGESGEQCRIFSPHVSYKVINAKTRDGKICVTKKGVHDEVFKYFLPALSTKYYTNRKSVSTLGLEVTRYWPIHGVWSNYFYSAPDLHLFGLSDAVEDLLGRQESFNHFGRESVQHRGLRQSGSDCVDSNAPSSSLKKNPHTHRGVNDNNVVHALIEIF